ncbi:DUF3619 family protein [Roseateles saccharophilus]|uniref:Uncharacterized protein DUF3619 n=1 Tax=Roseateles saccharophilus TaxID=304 RepID=A0A4V2VRI9_ROSSA|nr:DUF3619 family protein [Roseateles saccharophilus]MDG0831537.1 DUF3619 family protein [Roseateles saccharophilus]TCU98579.1 uncharacterized protein DUF3619 [Roseateles saccharophilus]
MKSPNLSTRTADLDARLDASVKRFGLRVAASLNERNAELPHDVTERLRFAREQALARAAQARAASTAVSAASPAVVQMGATLALGGGPRRAGSDNGLWAKLVSALPLLALVAGLLLMHRGQIHQQIVAAAEVDTALLSDNLPPAAFSDPGFAEFLRDGQE